MRVKLRRSAGSGKSTFIVFDSSSSVTSTMAIMQGGEHLAIDHTKVMSTFLHSQLCCAHLRLLLRGRLLILLHTPDLHDRRVRHVVLCQWDLQ